MKKTTLHTAAMALLMMGGASCATKTSVLGVVTKEPTNESALAALTRTWEQREEKKIECQSDVQGMTKEPTNESALVALARKWKQREEEKIECQSDVQDMTEYQPRSYDYIVSKLVKSTYPKYKNSFDWGKPGSCVSFYHLQRFCYRDVTKLVQENKEITKKQQLELLKSIVQKTGERVRVISENEDNDKQAGPKVADKLRKAFYKDLRTMMENAGFHKDVKSDVGKILKGSWSSFSNWSPSKNPVGAIQKLIDKCD